MPEYIEREKLYREIAELEELARRRVIDTPSSSPAYMRYVAQLNERTSLKHRLELQPTIDPVQAAGGCYCRECRFADERIKQIEFMGRNPVLELNTYEYHPLQWCSYGRRREGAE